MSTVISQGSQKALEDSVKSFSRVALKVKRERDELLEALKALVNYPHTQDVNSIWHKRLKVAQAVIDKVEGRS